MSTTTGGTLTVPTVTTPTPSALSQIKPPEFSRYKPRTWFIQQEAQFRNYGIVTETDKFYRTLPLIETESAAEVEDVVITPDQVAPFQVLRNVLIARFTKSKKVNLILFLDRESIGNRLPSQYLRHLKGLVPDIDDEVLRARRLSHLPESIQACLVIQPQVNTDDLAKHADKIHEVYHPDTVAAVTKSSARKNAQLAAEFAALTAFVAARQARNSRSHQRSCALSRSRRRDNNRPRSRSNTKVFGQTQSCWYHLKFEKLQGETIVAEVISHLTSRRLFITDRTTGTRYLVDTGSDVSVTPCRRPANQRDTSGYQLFAANGTFIDTYGYTSISPNLGLRRDLTRRFVEADVSKLITGADFLHHFNLLPDLRSECLIDSSTGLELNGQFTRYRALSVKLLEINGDSPYASILKEFLAITKPEGLLRNTEHSTLHHFRRTPGPPISCRVRRLAPDQLKIAHAEFSSMLKLGTARRCESSWTSPLHLAPKKNGEWRPCGDYSALNDRTISDKYPVRYLEDFAANLYGKIIFSTIDLVKVFNQIPIEPEDIQKTAIITPFGLFEFPYMTFGLRNAAQAFQRLIDEVTRDLLFLFPYIDDILVASDKEEKHLEYLRILLQRLQDYGLIVNVAKSVLEQPEVIFLGHTINAQGIKPPRDRVNVFREFTRPTTVKALRRYLGTLNFYRKFIKRAAEILAPLNAATQGLNIKGKHPVTWTPALEEAFTRSKQALAEATLLSHPKIEAEWAIFTDASDHAIEISSQKHASYDRELQAIYEAVLHFRHIVEGRHMIIFTDHKPLTHAFKQKPERASPWQYRRLDYIAQFSTDIRYSAPICACPAETLSIQRAAPDGSSWMQSFTETRHATLRLAQHGYRLL
ncbi:uncharacterized protein LOC107044056 [Diachasma alloeum]|uniref:uncharacterized protein LOC107044056 n=1 Tax=Diachasma alloeum TaxID=454923 RepID=UPI0007381620|nr:uncharacterized protein LOC107044056 [Diachasma alloeum]